MVFFSAIATALVAATVVSAHDTSSKLTKPPLHPNLDYLRPPLVAKLPETKFTRTQWGAGWIPSECKKIIEGGVESSLKFNAADIEVYNVKYSDCGDAWVFCHHKNSPITIDQLASQWGKMPVQMRSWVRHVIDLPGDATWAFEWDGTTTFIKPTTDLLTVIIHETGHSLDLSGAYADKPVSNSDKFFNAYNADSDVPDPYSGTNLIEDVAQNTVVATFNENIAGGLQTVEPGWEKIKNQYFTIRDEAKAAGHGNSILVPGENIQCTHRMPPSAAVSTSGSSKLRRMLRRDMPKVGLSNNVKHINTGRVGDAKHSHCKLGR